LLGPNGAGKTTLLNVLSSLLPTETGQITYFGEALRGNESEIRRRIGLVSHQSMCYAELTVEENLRFFAGLYALPHPEQRITEVLGWVELTKQRSQVTRTLSRGMQQRLSLARALLHDPPILLLDEPFTGLDQNLAGRMQQLIRQLSGHGKSMLLVSHHLNEALSLATRALVLHRGQIVDQFALDGMREADLSDRYQAALARPA
jgi:ABC-type multidrug transport system, ATPase component